MSIYVYNLIKLLKEIDLNSPPRKPSHPLDHGPYMHACTVENIGVTLFLASFPARVSIFFVGFGISNTYSYYKLFYHCEKKKYIYTYITYIIYVLT